MPTKKLMESSTISARFKCLRCRKWKDFSQGHTMVMGKSDQCAPGCVDCWHEVQKKILQFVFNKQWRLETTITSYICKYEGTWTMERVIDELFQLVQEKKLEWFGAKDSLSKPLKYRYLYGLPQHKDNAVNLAS